MNKMEGTGKHETMGFVETRLAKADPVPDRTGCDRVFTAVLQWFVVRQFSVHLAEIQNEQLQYEVQELSSSITERYAAWQAELKELSSSLGRDMLNQGTHQYPEGFKRESVLLCAG